MYVIYPVHPRTGPWVRVHKCSIPNPVLATGSLFLRPILKYPPYHKMVQNSFKDAATAHITDAGSYATLNPGFNFAVTAYGKDPDTVDLSQGLLRRVDVRFMLIHLQQPGNMGVRCAFTDQKDAPWYHNIWGEGSPYVEKIRQADHLLGEFVEHLKDMGKWDDTLLVVTGDHGQASEGWHLPSSPESWLTPAVFVGPNVARGKKIPYADQIDIVPTVCDSLAAEPPYSGEGAGRVLYEIKAKTTAKIKPHPQRIRRINEVLKEYYELLDAPDKSAWVLRKKLEDIAREGFPAEDILRWHEAGSLEKLIQTNRKVVEKMKALLQKEATGR